MEEKKKMSRFSEKEIEILIQCVQEKSGVIHAKFSDVINNAKKPHGLKSMLCHLQKELLKNWKVGLKHVAKKGASEVQKERIKTGDGKLEVET